MDGSARLCDPTVLGEVDQDVFDLDFLWNADAYQSLLSCARHEVPLRYKGFDVPAELQEILDGRMPGEEILVRRMLWEIVVRKAGYDKFVNSKELVFFEALPDAVFKIAPFRSSRQVISPGDPSVHDLLKKFLKRCFVAIDLFQIL